MRNGFLLHLLRLGLRVKVVMGRRRSGRHRPRRHVRTLAGLHRLKAFRLIRLTLACIYYVHKNLTLILEARENEIGNKLGHTLYKKLKKKTDIESQGGVSFAGYFKFDV